MAVSGLGRRPVGCCRLVCDDSASGLGLRGVVGHGSVPSTGMQRPSRVHLLAECREGRG